MPNIWQRYKNNPPQKLDSCGQSEVGYMLYNYRMACACLPGQHAHSYVKVWAGRRRDEPKGTETHGELAVHERCS